MKESSRRGKIHENHERSARVGMLASAPAALERPRIMKILPFLLALPFVGSAGAQGPAARAGTDSPALREVVITATRIAADPFNIPAAISRVTAEQRSDATLQ